MPFLIAAAIGLFVVAKIARRRHRWWRYAHAHHRGFMRGMQYADQDHGTDTDAYDVSDMRGGPYRSRGFRRAPWRQSFFGHPMFDVASYELRLTKEQERLAKDAFGRVKDSVKQNRKTLKEIKGEYTNLLRAETFDEDAFAALGTRFDEAYDRVKQVAFEAGADVHRSLDADQRSRLADMLDNRGRFGSRFWA